MIRNQLIMYTETLMDVNAVMGSENFVEPAPTASPYVIYRQNFEELKSPVQYTLNKNESGMNRVVFYFINIIPTFIFYICRSMAQRRIYDVGPLRDSLV